MGKSELLYRLLGDLERIGAKCEVINGDAIQHYRGLDIGSAKPSPRIRARWRHHLIDTLDPNQSYSVVEFVGQARQAATEITARGHLPIVCGGSVYFICHLLRGLPPTPPPDAAVRARLQRQANGDRKTGAADLHGELLRIDPLTAARIHPHDHMRTIRALEIYHTSGGKPPSQFPRFPASPSPFRSLCIALRAPRPLLRERITVRLANMDAAGLASEVAGLVARGYGGRSPGLRAIGYQQFFDSDGRLRPSTEQPRISEEITSATVRYAKQQLSFIKQLPVTRYHQTDEYLAILRAARAFLDSRSVSGRYSL